MSNSIVDLDLLIPKNNKLVFSDLSGKRYEIAIFIPSAVAFLIVDNIEIITRLFRPEPGKPRITKDSVSVVFDIVTEICKRQHPEITRDWLESNVGLPELIVIVYKLALPVYEFLSNTGFLETVTPDEKKPS